MASGKKLLFPEDNLLSRKQRYPSTLKGNTPSFESRMNKSALTSSLMAGTILFFLSNHLDASDVWKSDPFMGDYQGQWAKAVRGVPQSLVAQVVPRAQGKYIINFMEEFDQRCPLYVQANANLRGSALELDDGSWSGSIENGTFTGEGLLQGNKIPFTLTKVERPSPRLGAIPPAGAIVLFDGTGFDHWIGIENNNEIKAITWKLVGDGAMEVAPTLEEHAFATSIGTKQAYHDYHLHLEFRLPLFADVIGQSRGNSGIIFEDYAFVELQVLDSYGLPGYYDECGGMYKVSAPQVNMCRPPLQWQSYDIIYHGAQYAPDGKLVHGPVLTVDHNGKRVQTSLEIPVSEGAINRRLQDPDSRMPGRIRLQNHGDPVQYRNIWLKKLPALENPSAR